MVFVLLCYTPCVAQWNMITLVQQFPWCCCMRKRAKYESFQQIGKLLFMSVSVFTRGGNCPGCSRAKTEYTQDMWPVLALANSKSSKQPFRFTPKGNLEFANFAMRMFFGCRRKPETHQIHKDRGNASQKSHFRKILINEHHLTHWAPAVEHTEMPFTTGCECLSSHLSSTEPPSHVRRATLTKSLQSPGLAPLSLIVVGTVSPPPPSVSVEKGDVGENSSFELYSLKDGFLIHWDIW